MDNLEILTNAWLNAKIEEAKAVEWRRKTEDRLLSLLGIPESLEGIENAECGQYKIKVVGRMNRKIDAEKLQELALSNGLQDHVSALFRFKPEINTAAWKSTDTSITNLLLDAITTTPGRPSFSITLKD